jgi:hypothetical protein
MSEQVPFSGPMDSHLTTKYTEYVAYSVLKYCEPAFYTDLVLSDAPDLQKPDYSVGIEVTEAISQQQAQIDGEFVKYRFGKESDADRARCKKKIELCGGYLDDYSLTYPLKDLKDEQEIFQTAIRRKMKKLPTYRQKGFCRVGLFLLYEEPPIPVTLNELLSCFEAGQEACADQYDFLYFCAHSSLLRYEPKTKEYQSFKIGREQLDSIKLNARIKVESGDFL